MPNPNKLKYQIIKKGVTQRELAKAIGSNEEYISKMCNHEVNARESTLKKIAKFLQCEISDII